MTTLAITAAAIFTAVALTAAACRYMDRAECRWANETDQEEA